MKRMRMIGVVLALGVLTSSCYGPFDLTRSLWKWNGNVGAKWVNEGVFLVLNVVPVYGAAAFVDAVILNSVKFWTGKSAMQSRVIEQGDLKAVLTPEKDGKLVRLEVFRKGTLVQTAVMRADPDGSVQAYTLDGAKLVSRTLGDGTIELSGADGKVVAAYPAGAAAQYLQ